MGRRIATSSGLQVWASRAGLVAVVVLVVQLLWRAVLLHQGFFTQDDFLAMAVRDGADRSEVLSGDYAGGFSPGGSTLVWLSLQLAPLSWPLAAGTVLVLQAAATAMMWLVLSRLLGDRWLRVPILVAFAFSPLTLWSTQWWVLGLEFWAATLFLLIAVWSLLRGVRSGTARGGAVAVLAVTLALLFDERAVLDPIVLAGVALVAQPGETVRARVVLLARTHLGVWVALLLVLLGYGVLRWQAAPRGGGLGSDLGSDLGDVVTGYLRHGLAEVFGGPWIGQLPAHAYLVPTSWVVALNGALLLGLVGATMQRGGPAARASLGMLVVFVAGSVGVLTLAGQANLLASLGLVHRFAAELAPVVALCVAGAVSALTLPSVVVLKRSVLPEIGEVVVAVGASIVLLASAGISTAFLAGNLFHADDRTYVERARAGLRSEPQAVLIDSGVPDGVISPWYGEAAKVSTVLAYAPENPVFDLPSHTLRMVRDDGRLAPVIGIGEVSNAPAPDPDCGFAVRSGGTTVPMQAQVPAGRWVLRLGYYTDVAGFASVDVAGTSHRFAVRDGLNEVQLIVVGAFAELRMSIEQAGATLCLTDAAAGVPEQGPL